MRVIVDQDETLCQFVVKVLRRWNSLQGTSFKRDEIRGWRLEEALGMDTAGVPDLLNRWMAEPGFFEDLEPMPGAIEGFNALRSQGHDVLVATSIPEVAENAYDDKRRWMRRWFPDWSMKNFIACSRKGSLDGDVIIDDGAHNISDWINAGKREAIIFDAPWNRNQVWNLRTDGPWSVQRAVSWEEVLKKVQDIHFTSMGGNTT